MPTADSQSRIEELKARWEADPSSRIFVQLADEYRRQGRNAEAIAVLEKGLATQPNYVSAQVALGRCRLAAGEAHAAVAVLTRVTDQDPSHPLAGKLLVEAHLQAGEVEEASRRLELYRMLADSGPEIEELEQLVEQGRKSHGESPASAAAVSGVADPASPQETGSAGRATEPPGPERPEVEDLVFDLDPTDLPPLDPFDLSTPPVPTDTSEPFKFDSPLEFASIEAPARRQTEVRSATLHEAPTKKTAEAGAVEGDEPFGDLLASEDLSRWNRGFRDEGIFELGVSGPSPPAPNAEAPRVPAGRGRELEAPPIREERDEATVTLGRLYMAQGHREEAARIFRAILDQDPTNEVSLAALAELEGSRVVAPASEPLSLVPPLADSEPSLLPADSSRPAVEEEADGVGGLAPRSDRSEPHVSSPAPSVRPDEAVPVRTAGPVESPQEPPPSRGGVTARKIAALEDYLARLRQMAH